MNERLTTGLVGVCAFLIAFGSGLVGSLGVGLIVGGILGAAWTVLFVRDVPGQESKS